jgi:hypothetical protein
MTEPIPTIEDIKDDLDELHYQAENRAEPWLLGVERRYRWLLAEYFRAAHPQNDELTPDAVREALT